MRFGILAIWSNLAKTLKLFFLGLVISFVISEFEDIYKFEKLQGDPVDYLISSFTFSSIILKLGYLILLAIILPFVAITQLKKRLDEKYLLFYSFLSGITFGFTIISIKMILDGTYYL